MNEVVVEFYRTCSGKIPFLDWLRRVKNKQFKARILQRLDYIKMGNFGDHKYLQKGVYELRLKFGSGYRVYYGIKGDTVVIILLGGDKKSQQIDVEKVVEYWRRYNE